jgi:hypothetical protein
MSISPSGAVLKGRVLTSFPTNVRATGGITITKENGEWVISQDWTSLPDEYPFIRWDAAQGLTSEQQQQARENLGGEFVFQLDRLNTNLLFQEPVQAEIDGGITGTPLGDDYFNTIIAAGSASIGSGGAHVWRSTLVGQAVGEEMVEFERVDAFGSGAMRFAKYGQRETAIGSLALQWLGQPKSALKGLTHDLFDPIAPDEVGWDAFGLETRNPGIAVKLMEVPDAEDTDDVRGNVAVGRDSSLHLIGGIFNTTLGYRAMAHGFYCSNNTALGRDSLSDNVLGDWNTAVGARAALEHQEGSANIYVGASAGQNHVTGGFGIYIGYEVATGRRSGDRGIFIGALSGENWDAVSNLALIGHRAGEGISPYDNAFILHFGNLSSSPLLAGDFDTLVLAQGGEKDDTAAYYLRSNAAGGTGVYGFRARQTVTLEVTSSYQAFHANPILPDNLTINTLRGFYAQMSNVGTGVTVTNAYAFVAQSNWNVATNNYGFFGNLDITVGKTVYNFYASGTAPNWFNGATGFGNYIEMSEMTAPDAPAADKARIYIDDSGGKTRLMVRFATGDPQQVAIEP